MEKQIFTSHQTVYLTNKCNLRCPWCIVIDKKTIFQISILNEKLVRLLDENSVKQVRVSWWEPFLDYKNLTNFINILNFLKPSIVIFFFFFLAICQGSLFSLLILTVIIYWNYLLHKLSYSKIVFIFI